MRAPTPENQADRLEELESYGILDTEAEDSFDEVTALVKQICDVPVALISLVDADRQWFKSRDGFEPVQTSIEMAIWVAVMIAVPPLSSSPITLKSSSS